MRQRLITVLYNITTLFKLNIYFHLEHHHFRDGRGFYLLTQTNKQLKGIPKLAKSQLQYILHLHNIHTMGYTPWWINSKTEALNRVIDQPSMDETSAKLQILYPHTQIRIDLMSNIGTPVCQSMHNLLTRSDFYEYHFLENSQLRANRIFFTQQFLTVDLSTH